jgi:hypothetical protein
MLENIVNHYKVHSCVAEQELPEQPNPQLTAQAMTNKKRGYQSILAKKLI